MVSSFNGCQLLLLRRMFVCASCDMGDILARVSCLILHMCNRSNFRYRSCLDKTIYSPRGNSLNEASDKTIMQSADWIAGDSQKLKEQGDWIFVPNQTK